MGKTDSVSPLPDPAVINELTAEIQRLRDDRDEELDDLTRQLGEKEGEVQALQERGDKVFGLVLRARALLNLAGTYEEEDV